MFSLFVWFISYDSVLIESLFSFACPIEEILHVYVRVWR